MISRQLDNILRDLPRAGQLVKDRGYRQVWRFEAGGKAYYLKFYPREGSRLKRLLRGNPAMREFLRLQMLQKASIPSPRAVAQLTGFRIDQTLGDALIIDAIEPSVQLDEHLASFELAGKPIPNHLQLSKQVRHLVHQLGAANLGHNDLHLGNILLHNQQLYLLDGYAVRPGGLRLNDVMMLGHSVGRFATRTDMQRGWGLLGAGSDLPRHNPVATRQHRKFMERATQGDNRYFGTIEHGAWTGRCFLHAKFPRRWSVVSRLNPTKQDWDRAFARLLEQVEKDQLTIIKRTRSGDVLAGEVVLGGKPVDVIVKRPRRRHWYRYVSEIGRSRPKRAWAKGWHLVARDIPTAWPMLMMEKRALGYVTDSLIVVERVPGTTLAAVDLDAIAPEQRDMLFRRTGRVLRQIESHGFAHFDAKASNWIVFNDDATHETPILIDADGVRQRRWTALGIKRLLRSMKEHPQYTAADSLALCQGYAPYAEFRREPEPTPE